MHLRGHLCTKHWQVEKSVCVWGGEARELGGQACAQTNHRVQLTTSAPFRSAQDVITYLRQNCAGSVYSTAMSPVVCAQVLCAFRHLARPEGKQAMPLWSFVPAPAPLTTTRALAGLARIQRVRDNSTYFRSRLQQMGVDVMGEDGSPVVPLLLYHPAKCTAFSREALDVGVSERRGARVCYIAPPSRS